MKAYGGNRYPFLYGLYAKADEKSAMEVLERLAERECVCFDEKASAAARRRMLKASAVLLFLSPAAVRDECILSDAALLSNAGVRTVAVYLEKTELPAGLSLLLGTTQGVSKYAMDGDAFYEKLLSAPALAALTVTDGQKLASKRAVTAIAFGAAAAVLVTVLTVMRAVDVFSTIGADTTLGRLGVSGNPKSITHIYLYGENLEDAYRKVSHTIDPDTGDAVLIFNDNLETTPYGTLSDITDFAQLVNLEELCVAGNDIKDITPLYGLDKLRLLDVSANDGVDLSGVGALTSLETLDIALCGSDIDPKELAALPNLKTLCLSADMRYIEDALPDAPFEIKYVEAGAYTYEDLKRASLDESVHIIRVMDGVTVPAGETVTIRKGVFLCCFVAEDEMTDIVFANNGTVEIAGCWEFGPSARENRGTVRILDGGVYSGGMCKTLTNGTFIIEKGGTFFLERGHNVRIDGGLFEIDGRFQLRDGGRFALDGGRAVNNGVIDFYSNARLDINTDLSALPGTGTYNDPGE